jgi:glycosyltransferase involved in cell wall biosynthesis
MGQAHRASVSTEAQSSLLIHDWDSIDPLMSNANPAQPLVSCLMVSRGNLFPAKIAVTCFLEQTYPNRELVIVSAQPNSPLEQHVAGLNNPAIRFVQSPPVALGELRNRSVEAANGRLLCTWDDDDLYAPNRIERQLAACKSGVAAAFISRLLIWWPARRIVAISADRPWENSMMVRREALPEYPSIPRHEDAAVVNSIKSRHKIATLDEPDLYCYVVNEQNTCDPSHFEKLIDSADWVYPDYDAELARLTAKYPIRFYADTLVATSRSPDGEVSHLPRRPPLIRFAGKKFGKQDIHVDGIHFTDCVFEGSRFLYSGGAFPVFENCRMEVSDIRFLGSAGNTVNWLRQLKRLGFNPNLG